MDTSNLSLDVEDSLSSNGAIVLDLEHFLPYRLSLLANSVSRVLSRLYDQEHGLTVAEWRLIAILARFGPQSANQVSERSSMDKVRVSRAVSRATAAGFVDRQIDGQDRRRSVLTLTPQGRAVHDHIVPLALSCEAEMLGGLSDSEIDQFHDLLTRIMVNASIMAPQGDCEID